MNSIVRPIFNEKVAEKWKKSNFAATVTATVSNKNWPEMREKKKKHAFELSLLLLKLKIEN